VLVDADFPADDVAICVLVLALFPVDVGFVWLIVCVVLVDVAFGELVLALFSVDVGFV
jgi:hypothetical protein